MPAHLPETAQADTDSLDLPENLEQARKLRSENRSLLERLKAVEADYEAAASRLAAAQRREIERAAGEVLIDPSDVFRHTEPDTQQAFIDAEFHEVVGDNVMEAAKRIAAQKPHLARPPSGPPPTDRPIESLRRGASPDTTAPPAPTWADAIRRTGPRPTIMD